MADMTETPSRTAVLVKTIHELYLGRSGRAHAFRYGLLAFDLVTVAFIVVTSFIERSTAIHVIDALIGVVILLDLTARIIITRGRLRDLLHPASIADFIAAISFLAPLAGEGGGFLRVLRTIRLLHSYQLVARLRSDSDFFKNNEEVILAIVHLCVFIFVMTGVVYETQRYSNPDVANYIDAMYFTVTSLTTTGFGDITLQGTSGRLISVVIMIAGVTLFFNLAHKLFRPAKVNFPCPTCGLQRHDHDAVHCKACGEILNIPDEGAV